MVPLDARRTARHREIFAATLDLIAELGYDRLTMDAVAAASHAGKATLYRHWPSKAELVVAAVDDLKSGGHSATADTGSLRGDLLSGVCSDMGLDDPRRLAVMAGLSTAVHADAHLFAAFIEGFVRPRREEMEAIIVRAVDRGEIPASTDVTLIASVLPAVVLYHVNLGSLSAADPAFVEHVVDNVVLPAAGVTPPA